MFATGSCSEVFSPSTVRKSTCWPPSPCKGKGSRSTPTGSGLSIRPSPDRVVGSAEARASSTVNAAAYPMAAQPDQAYNLCLSEMRHYQDDDTMVLVLSQRAGAVQEAEYPVPLEQDTSEILDAEDDDVLAGYAEAASRLLKPSPYSELAGDHHSSMVSPAKLFKYDDVSHERFDSQTYEAPADEKRGQRSAAVTSPKERTRTILIPDDDERDPDASPDSNRVLFSSTEPDPSTCSPDKPVVDDQLWMQPPAIPGYKSSKPKVSSSSAGHRLHHESHPSSAVRVSNGATPPGKSKQEKKDKPKPFFASSPTRAADSSSSAISAPARSPYDSFQHTGPQDPQAFHPSSPVPPRVSNGARPKVSNGMSKKSSRAQIRERRAAERAQQDTQSPTEQVPHAEQAPKPPKAPKPAPASYAGGKVRGFWESGPLPSPDRMDDSRAAAPVEVPVDRDTDRLQGYQPAQSTQPFFPQAAPSASPRDNGSASSRAQFEWSKPKGVRDFFEATPTHSASAAQPLSAPDADVSGAPAVQNGRRNGSRKGRDRITLQHSSTHDNHAATANHHSHQQQTESVTAPDDVATHTARASPGYFDSDAHAADAAEDVDTKDHKGFAIADEHHDASRSFARAVSISSLETVVPEHSIRGRNSPRNSAMRRSSRRDAHMKARIATLDTSNLSAYSSSTLRRLAKDLGLSNTYKLSKSELVVQLVSEIILANMSLGWGVPEVSHGALAEPHDEDGYTSSDDEDATVYKFSEGHGQQHEVHVEEAVPQATLQRGRDTVERLGLEHGGEHAGTASAGGFSRAAGRKGAGAATLQQVDVDSDFENMSKLNMCELQQMCEDMQIEGWASMRKFEMISRLLMDVYEIER